MENWKQVISTPGLEVSDLGQVKFEGRILPQYSTQNGSMIVVFKKNRKTYSRKVAKLVCDAFLPGVGLPKHIDGDKTNTRSSNLRREAKTWSGTTREKVAGLIEQAEEELVNKGVVDSKTGKIRVCEDDVRQILKKVRQLIAS